MYLNILRPEFTVTMGSVVNVSSMAIAVLCELYSVFWFDLETSSKTLAIIGVSIQVYVRW